MNTKIINRTKHESNNEPDKRYKHTLAWMYLLKTN